MYAVKKAAGINLLSKVGEFLELHHNFRDEFTLKLCRILLSHPGDLYQGLSYE